MEFRLLGPLELVDDGGRAVELPAGKPRALLALLLLEARRIVSVARIVDALWGEAPPATAEAVVQGYASRLRKLLPDGALLRRGQAYVLHVDEGRLDLDRFERLRREGVAAAEERRWQQAATLLEAALALWRGQPLTEFEDESFARDETARLRELRLVVLQQRLQADLALGRAAEVVPELEALVREEPLRERLRELLMLALYRAGRQADALAAYQDAGRALRERLGLEPGPALQRLERAILVHDPALQLQRERLLASALGERVPLPGPLVPAARFPFAGRTEELAALRASLAHAKEREGAFVLLAGEAGGGKTRLIRELAHEAAAGGVLVCYGVSDAAVSTPYQPLLEWLEFLLRVSDPDALRESIAGAGEALIALMPELSRLVGARAAAESTAESVQIQRGATELLTRLSRVQPLLLVADDVHWADGETLHLLRRLARIAPEAHLVVLAAYRDRDEPLAAELSDTLTDLSRLDAVTRIVLGNLSPEEVSEFILGSTGADAPAELASSIGELTDGTPLLLCEVWRDLLESGAVEVSHTVQLSRPLSELRGPERVADVVRQRLSRLAPETVTLLELAAVAGPRFELRVLTRASSLDGGALRAALDEATRSGILDELPEHVPAYRFTHELVRRAIYDRINRLRRAELHERFADWLERLAGDRVAEYEEILGYHLEQAYRYHAEIGSLDEEAGALGDRAATHLAAAAWRAEALSDYDAVANLLERALAVGLADPRSRVRVQAKLGSALGQTRRASEADAVLTDAHETAARLGEREIAAGALVSRGWNRTGDPTIGWTERQAACEEAIVTLTELGDERGLADARRLLALALTNLGRREDARSELELALVHAEASGDPERRRSVINTLANLYIGGPTPVPEAIGLCEQLSRSATGDRVLEATLQRSLGILYAMDSRPREALDALALGGALLDEVRLRGLEVYRPRVAYARRLCGDRDGEERELLMTWDYFRDIRAGFDLRAWTAANGLASLYCNEGRFAEAADLHAYGREELVGASRHPWWLSIEARLAAHEGRLDDAAELAKRSTEGAETRADLSDAAECLAAAAAVEQAAGRTTEADSSAARAHALFERKGNRAGAARLRTLVPAPR